MTRLEQTLREMCLIPALSGYEQRMAAYLREKMQALGLTSHIDRIGNCITELPGSNPNLPPLMIFGHMDQIGFFVKSIEPTGFLRLERLGGVPEKVLPAIDVQVQCRSGRMIDGVIGMKSHHITPAEEKYVVEKCGSLFVDIGARSLAEVLALGIDVGQPVVYAPKFKELLGGLVSATSLDNRLACCMLVELAQALVKKPPDRTVFLVGSVQEEYNVRGAILAARAIRPEAAICIDIAIEGGTPDMNGQNHVRLGGGPVVSMYNFHGRGTLNGTIPHPAMLALLEQSAAKLKLPLQRYASIGILTDMAYVQFEGDGICGIDFGIPCRYTHTPSETCCIQDVVDGCKLLLQAIYSYPPAALASK